MNTKLLRQKVLDLAIHGKLVPQNPEHEPASKLLERIRGESLPLATAGKPSSAAPSAGSNAARNAHSKNSVIFVDENKHHYERFPDGNVKDIEDKIPFEIPENWTWCRIGNIVDLINGRAYRKPELLSSGKYKVLRVGNFFTNDSWYYSDLELEDSKYCYDGDLLYAWSASFGPKIWHGEKTIFHYHIWNVKFNNDLLDKMYLYYFFIKDVDTIKESTTGSTMVHVAMENMKPRFIPLPPLEEQKLIVEEIERIFALIDTVEQNKTDLETVIKQTKSKILDLAIHGKLVPQDKTDEPASKMLEKLRAEKEEKIANGQLKRDKNDSYIYKSANGKWLERKADGTEEEIEVPFEIPKSWSWCRLGDLGYTNIGLTYHPEDITDNGVPVLRSCNIKNDSLDFEDTVRVNTKILPNQYVQEGDILICARNGSQSLVGKCTIISDLQEPMSFGAFMAIFRSEMNPYILKYLQSFYFKDYMLNANSTQICQLTQAMLKNALIPVPPREEQKRIVSKIEELSTYLDTITKSIG